MKDVYLNLYLVGKKDGWMLYSGPGPVPTLPAFPLYERLLRLARGAATDGRANMGGGQPRSRTAPIQCCEQGLAESPLVNLSERGWTGT